MRTRPLVPAPAVIALILVVISLLLGLGQNGVPPTVGTVAAATPTSNPSLTPIPGDERVPATFPTQQGLPFQPPAELQSANGQLQTQFMVEPTTFDAAGTR